LQILESKTLLNKFQMMYNGKYLTYWSETREIVFFIRKSRGKTKKVAPLICWKIHLFRFSFNNLRSLKQIFLNWYTRSGTIEGRPSSIMDLPTFLFENYAPDLLGGEFRFLFNNFLNLSSISNQIIIDNSFET
jgi:hypothetical protein